MFFVNPQATEYIPDDFWTQTLSSGLIEAISNFNKFEDKINKQVYLEDFSRCLASFAIKEITPKTFSSKVDEFY